jgi:Na+-transporting methylmalonyl-CoA/oxaloacetate decarboxylase gamma subunit
MSKLTYGLVITLVGMGGTLLSLCALVLAVNLMKRFLPYREADEKERKEVV